MEGKNAHPLPGKVRAVIFDMDGLLIDTEKYLVPCWCQAAREMGFPMERRHALHIRSLAGKFAEAYLQSELGADFDYFKVRERRKELVAEKIRTEGLQPKKGAAELLRWLGKKGVPTAVATATDLVRAEGYLREVGLFPYIGRILSTRMVENGKPMPDVYLLACKELGEAPGSCVALEDSPNGILSAWRAGCAAVMVPDLTPPDEGLREILSGEAANLAAVIPLLEGRI